MPALWLDGSEFISIAIWWKDTTGKIWKSNLDSGRVKVMSSWNAGDFSKFWRKFESGYTNAISSLRLTCKRIPGNKKDGADALSRLGPASQDPSKDEDEADDCFDAKLYSKQTFNQKSDRNSYSPMARIYLHDTEYDDDDLILEWYLETLQ